MLLPYVVPQAHTHEPANPSRVRCHTNHPHLATQSSAAYTSSNESFKWHSGSYLPQQTFPMATTHFGGFSPLHFTAYSVAPQSSYYPISQAYYPNATGPQPYPMTPYNRCVTPGCYTPYGRSPASHAHSEPPHSEPVFPSISPSSVRSTSPIGLIESRSATSSPSIPSLTPPRTPEPPLTPEQFICELQRIRLQGLTSFLPIGRFRIQGEAQPVSVSRPRADGPFVIQHYLPNGKEDAISVAHVLAGVGVIVWCPPPKVQFVGSEM